MAPRQHFVAIAHSASLMRSAVAHVPQTTRHLSASSSSHWPRPHTWRTPPAARRGYAATGPELEKTRFKSEPLHILFCGSDEFSCVALRRLHAAHKKNPAYFRRIDVVVRPAKWTGRRGAILKSAPLMQLAMDLGLKIHLRDTFTGWDPPLMNGFPVNLIIAVSFGLFVPPRLLRAAKYGGLNIHPSLLPDLRGPAPIQHALLQRRSHTGVSLQTLSETEFDGGVVLAQTPLPGIAIPRFCTFEGLRDKLATHGANLLVRGILDALHVPPYLSIPEDQLPLPPYLHAPKLTSVDREVRWVTPRPWHFPRPLTPHDYDRYLNRGWTARDAQNRARVLGSVWTRAVFPDGGVKRIILTKIEEMGGNLLDALEHDAPRPTRSAWRTSPPWKWNPSAILDPEMPILETKASRVVEERKKEEKRRKMLRERDDWDGDIDAVVSKPPIVARIFSPVSPLDTIPTSGRTPTSTTSPTPQAAAVIFQQDIYDYSDGEQATPSTPNPLSSYPIPTVSRYSKTPTRIPTAHLHVFLRYFPRGDAIVLAMDGGGFIQVHEMHIEGEKEPVPAVRAVRRFAVGLTRTEDWDMFVGVHDKKDKETGVDYDKWLPLCTTKFRRTPDECAEIFAKAKPAAWRPMTPVWTE